MFERSVRSASGAIAGMTYNTMAEISEAQGKKQEALTYYKKALEQKNEPIIEALIKRKIAELSRGGRKITRIMKEICQEMKPSPGGHTNVAFALPPGIPELPARK